MKEGPRHGLDHTITTRSEKDILEYFQEDSYPKIVYLSPDATESLKEFKDDEIYIIGGIVDKTIKTGLTMEKAKKLGIKLRSLPIETFRKEKKFRLCLNIDTVFNIIDNYREQKDKSIIEAISNELPKRFKEGLKYT